MNPITPTIAYKNGYANCLNNLDSLMQQSLKNKGSLDVINDVILFMYFEKLNLSKEVN